MRKYDAFISYSHAKDKPIARALQSVAQGIGRPWWRRRALMIFRDDSSLAATPHLWPEIQLALDGSRFLVLLASPEAAASQWVNKEVEHWLATKGPRSLLVALTSGDLVWDEAANDFKQTAVPSLPPAIVGRFESEPKWVDLRDYRDAADKASKSNPDFLTRAADLAAAIHGMPKEDLLSDELRQQRRALATAWTAAACLALLAATAVWQAFVAIREKARVEAVLATSAKSANSLVSELAEEFRGQKGIPQKFIIGVLGEARTLIADLSVAAGDRPELMQLQGKALAELSKTLRAQGDTKAALEDAQGAVRSFETLLLRDKSAVPWRISLAASYDRLGDSLFDFGRHGEAEQAYRKGLAISEGLGGEGGDVNALNVAVGQEKLAEVLSLQGKNTEAQDYLGKSLATRERLLAAAPDRIDLARAVIASHGKIAAVLLALGQNEAAGTHQTTRLDAAQKLAAGNRDNNDLQRDLAQAYRGMASVLAASGRAGEAQALLRKDYAIIKAIADSDPERADWRRDQIAALDRVGDLLLADNKPADALQAFRENVATAEELAGKDPNQSMLQHTLALTHKKAGDALRADGKSEEAAAAYQKSLAIRRQLPRFPASPAKWELDLEQNYQFLCDVLIERNQSGEALALAQERVQHFQSLDASHASRVALIAQALGSLAWYGLFSGDWERSLEASQAAETLRPDALWIKLNHAHALMLSGKDEAALDEYVAHKGSNVTDTLSWNAAVSSDFALLRKAGRSTALMSEVESKLRL